MSFEQTVLLSAIAGLTIFLGLPVGRLRNLSTRTQALLTTAAAGVILFLIWDILAQAVEPVEGALEAATSGEGPTSDFVVNLLAFGLSLAFGLLSLVWFAQRMRRRRDDAGMSVHDIALGTAVGLGLHNFSEGLAIGQSAATGATAFALDPRRRVRAAQRDGGVRHRRAADHRATADLDFLLALGVIGGGPTFLGGVIGYTFVSPLLSIVFLGVAAGALIYVFNEMMATSRKFAQPVASNVALLIGLLVAFGTDFFLVAVGA